LYQETAGPTHCEQRAASHLNNVRGSIAYGTSSPVSRPKVARGYLSAKAPRVRVRKPVGFGTR